MKRFLITVLIIAIITTGIVVGIYMYNIKNNIVNESFDNNDITEVNINENTLEEQNTIEIANKEEKTTPNTLLVYKTYYTKCNHYINEYKDIEIDEVNLSREELLEKNKEWKIEEFSSEQVVLSREIDEFCGEHYKLKLEDGTVNVYIIDEQGNEEEYKSTGITEEYLTYEDILKLKEGIVVNGQENLSSTIEDYE